MASQTQPKNHLLRLAQPLFWLLDELSPELESAARLDALKSEVRTWLAAFKQASQAASLKAEAIEAVHYCFCAALDQAGKMGCWFSIGPAAFASAAGRSLAARLPRDRVVPESDGPFATEGGTPVQPWSMGRTAQLFAPHWECSEHEALATLSANSQRLLLIMNWLP